jgi:hypothetical protein
VFAGASTLSLPERPPSDADATLRPFQAPETAEPPSMTTLSPESGQITWRHDIAKDLSELIGQIDSGLERFDAIDMAVRTRIQRRYAIAGDDPLSAEAAMGWTMDRARGDWRVRVETTLKLSATSTHFRIEQSLAAFEGETKVFARDWDDRVARDLV